MSPTRVSDKHRAEHSHRYVDPRSGLILPYSVTGIVGNYSDGDKAGRMAGAAARLTREGLDYRKIWDESSNRGKRVHGGAADWAQGKVTNILPQDRPYMNAVVAFMKAKHPEWIEVERAVVAGQVGGRFDAVVYFDGLYWLLDFKTGKHYLWELVIQLAGYSLAEGMIAWDKNGKATHLDPLPHIDRYAGLYLDDTGTATLIDKKPNGAPLVEDEDREAFLHLLAVRQRADLVKVK